MRLSTALPPLALALGGSAQGAENKCPWEEYACFDVINSSLCLSQNAARGTAEQLAKCVTYDNGMSDLPGAAKVSEIGRAHV